MAWFYHFKGKKFQLITLVRACMVLALLAKQEKLIALVITLSAILQSFVLQVGGQYPLFSGGPVWLQLGTAFVTWRGRDILSLTRVTLSFAMHSPTHAGLWGMLFKTEWVPEFPLIMNISDSFC